jgi:hypothetical protein
VARSNLTVSLFHPFLLSLRYRKYVKVVEITLLKIKNPVWLLCVFEV